ncbi:hypothetical protein L3i22_077780 [Actinoplanes sp. L3-i22]|nr:hypothetical protein L3i22_077780 [Actinoplanes sp. L3-i22]
MITRETVWWDTPASFATSRMTLPRTLPDRGRGAVKGIWAAGSMSGAGSEVGIGRCLPGDRVMAMRDIAVFAICLKQRS